MCMHSQEVYTSEDITLLCGVSSWSKGLSRGMFEGPDDAIYAKSKSGWIDSELFLVWMKKVFLKYCGSQHPVLLFTDGHTSHVNLDMIDMAHENIMHRLQRTATSHCGKYGLLGRLRQELAHTHTL